MLTGVTFEKAIDCWKKGREVIVIDRNSRTESGGYDNFPFEELFRNVELLADVPAVEDPDFKLAVDQMIHDADPQPGKPSGGGTEQIVKNDIPAEKPKKETALELSAQGLGAPEIAKELDVPYSTVYSCLNPEKCGKKKSAGSRQKPAVQEMTPGWNADREACKTCRYRPDKGMSQRGMGCDYLDLVGHSRGCSVEDCDKYEKGNRMEKK